MNQNDGCSYAALLKNDEDFINNRIARALRAVLCETAKAVQRTGKREVDKAADSLKPEPLVLLLDGAWGAGKSRVLEQLRRLLSLSNWCEGTRNPIVVQLNAWRYQGMSPLWFALITVCIKRLLREKSLGYGARVRMWWSHAWRFGVARRSLRWIALLFMFLLLWFGTARVLPRLGFDLDWLTWLSFAGSFASIAALIWESIRQLLAEANDRPTAAVRFTHDPVRAVADFFEHEIDAYLKGPVVILIEDLDRCDVDVVVEFLAALQTLVRGPKLTYIVAADRRWLRDCIDAHYIRQRQPIVPPDATVGDLFLEKIFQMVITVPRLSFPVAKKYAHSVIRGSLEVEAGAGSPGGEAELPPARGADGMKAGAGSPGGEAQSPPARGANEMKAGAGSPGGEAQPPPARGGKEVEAGAGSPGGEAQPTPAPGGKEVEAGAGLDAGEQSQGAHPVKEDWLREDLDAALPHLQGNPRLIRRASAELWYRVVLQAQFVVPRRDDYRYLAGCTVLRIRWPLIAEHIEDPSNNPADVGLAASSLWHAGGPSPHPVPSRVASLAATPAWRAFARSDLLPHDPEKLQQYLALGRAAG
jgi:hypothetical protein